MRSFKAPKIDLELPPITSFGVEVFSSNKPIIDGMVKQDVHGKEGPFDTTPFH
jgi:hypothetical protein